MKRQPPDKRSPRSIWDRQYRLLGIIPFPWILKADELFAAVELIIQKEAEPIRQPPRLSGVAYMLAGFAVEVLIKAVLVQEGCALDAKGRFELDSHDLPALAQQAGLTLSAEESRLLARLHEYLTWAGRYPIPLTSEPMRPIETPAGGFAPVTYCGVRDDWPAVRALVTRLKELLPKVSHETPLA